jgi:hypothetical protein
MTDQMSRLTTPKVSSMWLKFEGKLTLREDGMDDTICVWCVVCGIEGVGLYVI